MASLISRIRDWRVRAVKVEQLITVLDIQVNDLSVEVRALRDDLAKLDVAATKQSEMLLVGTNANVRSALTEAEPTHVLFLVHHIEAWESLDAVHRILKTAEDFKVTVASIPRRFPGSGEFGDEDKVHSELESRGIEHVRLASTDPFGSWSAVRALKPDIIFRQSQWDKDLQPAFSTAALSFARLCLVPYETMNIVQNAIADDPTVDTAVDSEYHRACWMVFTANEMSKKAASKGLLGGSQFQIVGHPKADSLRSAEPFWPVERTDERLGERRGRVVWSAHHSIATGWTDFGVFPSTSEAMLKWAEESPDVDFTFMPHPALRPFTRSPLSPITVETYDDLISRWNALPNTAMYTGGSYPGLLRASDVLVTDGLSMLIEYQLLLKPVVFLERVDQRPFNDAGEVMRRGMHSVMTVEQARETATGFLNGAPDPLIEVQRENIQICFGESPSAPRIVAAMREKIRSERVAGLK